MRLLDKSLGTKRIDQMGLDPEIYQQWTALIEQGPMLPKHVTSRHGQPWILRGLMKSLKAKDTAPAAEVAVLLKIHGAWRITRPLLS